MPSTEVTSDWRNARSGWRRPSSSGSEPRLLLLARHLLARHLANEGLGSPHVGFRVNAREQIKGARNQPRPTRLVTSSQPGAIVAVEVLVEQDVILPVGIFLELLCAPINGSPAILIPHKNLRQSAADLFRHFKQGHVFA